ncbi:MAG TPA: hypothetical protein DEV97_10590 [Lachnospiraceae bacterium]|nr:hypothetical protein [Lachnospiraceae bacterium]
MTRFERELSGALGAFWKKEAEKELARIEKELEEGRITIDANGIARNSIGRILMSDLAEKVSFITDRIDLEATKAARSEAVSQELADFRNNARPATREEKDEMRAAFGKGQTVVNILTGERISL